MSPAVTESPSADVQKQPKDKTELLIRFYYLKLTLFSHVVLQILSLAKYQSKGHDLKQGLHKINYINKSKTRTKVRGFSLSNKKVQ